MNYKELAEKSQEELKEWVKETKPKFSNEDERQEFIKFAGMDAEARNAFIAEREPPDDAGEGAEVTPEPIKEPEGQSSPKEPIEPEPKEDPDESKEIIESLLDSYKAQVDKLNAGKGKQGEEIKRLKAELDEIKKQQPSAQQSEDISLPEPPDPAAYEDGVYSDDYQKDLRGYQVEVNKAILGYNKMIHELTGTVNELKTSTTTTAEQLKADREREAAEFAERQVNDMWNTLDKFRTEYGIRMTTDPRKINDIILRWQNSEGPEKQAALDAYNQIPEQDRAAFDKISAVAQTMYQFNEAGIPIDTRHTDVRAAAVESGKFKFDDLVSKKEESNPMDVDVGEARRKQLQSQPTSVSDQDMERSPAETGNVDRKNRDRLMELSKLFRKDPRLFKKNKELVDEFNSLHGKLGISKFLGPSKVRYDG